VRCSRAELTDAQWERLLPFLPPQRPRTGRPARDHRTILSAILWVLRTGAPWRDLPERFGPWATAWSRFRRWTAAGVWARILGVLQRDADAAGHLDWAIHYVDGTVVRAHQHAAGAQGGQAHEALGCSRGGFSSKVHLRAEGGGKRGYSYPTVRRLLARRHIQAVIPHRRDQRPDDRRHAALDRVAYRERNRVERLVNRLKQYRRVATRYDKRAVHYLAMVTLAAVLMWL
jgi:transposase